MKPALCCPPGWWSECRWRSHPALRAAPRRLGPPLWLQTGVPPELGFQCPASHPSSLSVTCCMTFWMLGPSSTPRQPLKPNCGPGVTWSLWTWPLSPFYKVVRTS